MSKKLLVFVSLLSWPVVLSVAGCDCDEGRAFVPDMGPPPIDMGIAEPCDGTDGTSVPCDRSMGTCCVLSSGAPTCVPNVDDAQCFRPFDCTAVEPPSAANGCHYTAPLLAGQLATHLDMASAPDGTVMVSGYAPGIPNSASYRDLVVGIVEDGALRWSTVDGVPADAVVTPDAASGLMPQSSGWRGGITAPGDEVGEFNSIAFSPDGSVVSVSYFDRTNRSLKFASSADRGATWSVHTAFRGGESGRYTSLAYLSDGRPAIAFLSVTPATVFGLKPTSRPRVIIANSASPAAEADWTLVPMAGDTAASGTPTPCTASLCAQSLICRADDGTCGVESTNPDIDCSHLDADGVLEPGCSRSTTCIRSVDGEFACVATRGADFIDEAPEVNGLYTSLRTTTTGLALVWHDRVRRTLMGNAYDSATGTWRAQGPFPIDGFDAVGSGDAGYSADLFIDAAGDWHVAYVEGAFEELRHAQIDGTTLGNDSPSLVRSRVDDGTRPPRDRAVVGSDADIVVLSTGEVRIVYQNSTHLEALMTTREPGVGSWLLQGGPLDAPLDEAGATGFWTCQALVGDTSHVATWWFDTNDLSSGVNGVRVFTVP